MVLLTFLAVPSLGSAYDLQGLANRAGAVVIAHTTGGVDAPDRVTFTLIIDRALKGDGNPPSIDVVHEMTRRVRGATGAYAVSDGDYRGMWFLTSAPNGSGAVLEPMANGSMAGLFLPATNAPPAGEFSYPAGTPLYETLVYELANGIDANPSWNPRLFRGLFDAGSSAVTRVYEAWLASANAGKQAAGLAGMLGQNSPDAIAQLVALYPKLATNPGLDDSVASLWPAWRRTDADWVSQLAQFASSAAQGSEIRRAAIHALAAVHTAESLPFLAGILAGGDAVDQSEAVYGISAFANGCPVKGPLNTVSMAYLQCTLPTSYRSLATQSTSPSVAGLPDKTSPLSLSGAPGGKVTRNFTSSSHPPLSLTSQDIRFY